MTSLVATDFDQRPLLVLALGGNALSPPARRAGYAEERRIVAATGKRLEHLANRGYRLLIVHGNGPQVGRLLAHDPGGANLDIHIAQTQGELGYLLLAALPHSTCVLTRVIVGEPPGAPVKPIGPVLAAPPADGSPCLQSGDGWRVVVASPEPREVLEAELIARLLDAQHVIAGGGGGIPISAEGRPVAGVVDKDRVASLLAQRLDADELVFATDVDGVYAGFDSPQASLVEQLSSRDARQMVASGAAAPGSMGPKVESAAAFAHERGRSAHICHLDGIADALDGHAGTRVEP